MANLTGTNGNNNPLNGTNDARHHRRPGRKRHHQCGLRQRHRERRRRHRYDQRRRRQRRAVRPQRRRPGGELGRHQHDAGGDRTRRRHIGGLSARRADHALRHPQGRGRHCPGQPRDRRADHVPRPHAQHRFRPWRRAGRAVRRLPSGLCDERPVLHLPDQSQPATWKCRSTGVPPATRQSPIP